MPGIGFIVWQIWHIPHPAQVGRRNSKVTWDPKLESGPPYWLLFQSSCKFPDNEDDADDEKSLSNKLPPVKGRCSELIGGFDHLVTPLSPDPIGCWYFLDDSLTEAPICQNGWFFGNRIYIIDLQNISFPFPHILDMMLAIFWRIISAPLACHMISLASNLKPQYLQVLLRLRRGFVCYLTPTSSSILSGPLSSIVFPPVLLHL